MAECKLTQQREINNGENKLDYVGPDSLQFIHSLFLSFFLKVSELGLEVDLSKIQNVESTICLLETKSLCRVSALTKDNLSETIAWEGARRGLRCKFGEKTKAPPPPDILKNHQSTLLLKTA